jgi:hypothetical protein
MGGKLSELRSYAASGAAPASVEDQMLMLSVAPGAEAITAVRDASKNGIGETIRINRPVFSGGSYTEAARIIGQAATISTTPIDLSSEQASIVIRRVAGPYSASGSAVQPYAIDAFALKRSVHDLAALVGNNLAYDRIVYLDSVFSLLFDGASTNVVRPGSLSADASFPTTGEFGLDLDTVYRAEQKLVESNVPRFGDGTYLLVVSARQWRQLKQDVSYSGLAQWYEDKNPLFSGVTARIGSVRVVLSQTIQTDTATVSGQTIQRGVMFGPGAVGYGIAGDAHVASSTDDNYGETPKVVWLAYEGLGILDERFLCSVRTI